MILSVNSQPVISWRILAATFVACSTLLAFYPKLSVVLQMDFHITNARLGANCQSGLNTFCGIDALPTV